MIGPELILIGLITGLAIVYLIDWAKKSCKKDHCIMYIVIACVIVLLLGLLLAVKG